MKELPKNQLDPRIKKVWRTSAAITIGICAVCVLVPLVILLALAPAKPVWSTLLVISVIVFVVLAIVFTVILPPIRYIRWRYEFTEDYVDIAKGIIWRKRYMIPFIRVQNTDTKQGPIMRANGLASVTVSTAAGEHVIPGLEWSAAEEARDHAAELARLAREDV